MLKDTITHEIEHYLQNLSNNIFGMPSQKIRSKNFNHIGQPIDHDKQSMPISIPPNYGEEDQQETLEDENMWDSEFYPRLKDSISEFLLNYKNYPIDKKRKVAKEWICESFDNRDKANYFFVCLKVYNFNKWKKAVKEFYKAVFNE